MRTTLSLIRREFTAYFLGPVGYVALGWVPAKIPFAHNLRSGDPFWVTLDKKGVRCVALSRDGRRALSGSHDRTVRMWELPSPDRITRPKVR